MLSETKSMCVVSQSRVVAPGAIEVRQPGVLASGDQRLRQIRHIKKADEPGDLTYVRVITLGQDPGGDVVHCGEAINALPIVLGATSSHPCAPVMTDDGGALVSQVVH